MDSAEGKLYIIATPIGNMKDITFRAIETLKEVDYLLCEDTRRSLKLLNHYQIRKRLESYFLGNEGKKLNMVLNDLLSGKVIGLVSEGGTPCISDPGNLLVRSCHEKGIPVVPIPGASALSTALSVSGIADRISVFVGFLPRSRKKINKVMAQISQYNGNIILYESPYRIRSLLELIHKNFGNVKIFLFKELTKIFENVSINNVKNILAEIDNRNFKGEYIVIFNKEIC
ncbi:MAG: 16S rRNA (cytidine(1402)-2'-O)-methyltransferase [Spirochaetes bacterium]|nr:16S rRNA (cytidine(1402)-2'-O)-methyltransferase [Spirochaetota bacterium]